jgi:hypothetical protein
LERSIVNRLVTLVAEWRFHWHFFPTNLDQEIWFSDGTVNQICGAIFYRLCETGNETYFSVLHGHEAVRRLWLMDLMILCTVHALVLFCVLSGRHFFFFFFHFFLEQSNEKERVLGHTTPRFGVWVLGFEPCEGCWHICYFLLLELIGPGEPGGSFSHPTKLATA